MILPASLAVLVLRLKPWKESVHLHRSEGGVVGEDRQV